MLIMPFLFPNFDAQIAGLEYNFSDLYSDFQGFPD
jgi:hypothetical protein